MIRACSLLQLPLSTNSNNQIIPDDLELRETFNNYFKSAIANLVIKEYESKYGVDLAIEKFKDHPSVNLNVCFEPCFIFKDISETDYKKRFIT